MNTAELSYAESVQQNRNKDEMLYRSLGTIVQLYTDKSHFIYELLQNAEDAGASKISFVQYDDRLEVLHNGRSFTNENLYALCDVGESDKTTNLNQIGEFGVGFKSVYGICKEVLLYSHPTENEISQGLKRFSYKITDFTDLSDIEDQDFSDEYTTKFVFSYAIGEKFSSFTYYLPLKNTISKRLQNLGVTTLLFLKNLKSINYEIDMEDVKAKGSYSLERLSVNDHCTLIRGVGIGNENDDGNKIPSYLVFSTPIDVSNSQRTVDIAFPVTKTDEGKYIFRKANNSNISVYFPTGTESKLNFIVQGPFRTAPNRSDVPADNEDNKKLANIAADLLCESIRELAKRNELNYSLIEILLLDESAFENYALFKVMYEKMRQLFSTEELIPYDGGYTNAKSALIARGKDLSTVFTDELITELWNDGREYHWLPAFLTETNKEYTKTYTFLTRNGVKVLTPGGLRKKFNDYPNFFKKQSDEWLIQLYNMFTNSQSEFSSRNQSSMSYARFIKTTDGEFVSAYKSNGQPNVFLPCKNESLQKGMNVVDRFIYENCKYFFHSILELREPNERELFISDFKERYMDSSSIEEVQYISDLKNLLLSYRYDNEATYTKELNKLFQNYLPIRCLQEDKGSRFIKINRENNAYKGTLYFPIGKDGSDIEIYYRGVYRNTYVDIDFYRNKLDPQQFAQFQDKLLRLMGFRNDISIDSDKRDGNRKPGESDKDPSFKWEALDGFAWALSLDHIDDVVKYIQQDNGCDDASNTKKKKSSIIFKFLKNNENRLSGKIRHKKDGSVEQVDEKARIISQLTPDPKKFMRNGNIEELPYRWLYTKDGRFVAPCEITKYELDETLYGNVDIASPLYDLLGFKSDTDRDKDEAMKKKYTELTEDEKLKYFEIGLKKYDMSLDTFNALVEQQESHISQYGNHSVSKKSNDFDFPSYRVRNWESLRKHVAEILYEASPVKYEQIVRSIRTSKSQDDPKSYLESMYLIDYEKKYACQMCHNSTDNPVACQIENKPTKELSPMYLCLCPNCAAKFRSMRQYGADTLLNKISRLSRADIENQSPVEINFKQEKIWFTQTHIAEIKELLAIEKEVHKDSNSISALKASNDDSDPVITRTDSVVTSLEVKKTSSSVSLVKSPTANANKESSLESALKIVLKKSSHGMGITALSRQVNCTDTRLVEQILNNAEWATFQYGRYCYVAPKKEPPKKKALNDNVILSVDFDSITDMSYTKPISLSYFGDVKNGFESWTELYVSFFATLYDDYPHLFADNMSFSKNGENPDLAETVETSQREKYCKVAGTKFLLRVNFSVSAIVRRIKLLLDMCSIDYDNVVIKYHQSEDNDTFSKNNIPHISNRNNRNEFYHFLIDEVELADSTALGYSYSIEECERFAQEYGYKSWKLYTPNLDEAKETVGLLRRNTVLTELDMIRHNQLSSALKRFSEFLEFIR